MMKLYYYKTQKDLMEIVKNCNCRTVVMCREDEINIVREVVNSSITIVTTKVPPHHIMIGIPKSPRVLHGERESYE